MLLIYCSRLIVFPVGLPGAGKSSLLAKLSLPKKFVKISSDNIRSTMFGVSFEPSIEPEVWKIVHAWVEGCLKKGDSVFLDMTNTTKKRRKPWIEYARQYNCAVIAIYFDVPLKEVKRRNKTRPDHLVLPDEVIERKWEALEPPELSEGIDFITTVSGRDDYAKVQKIIDGVSFW